MKNLAYIVIILLSVTACKPRQIVTQDRVIYRDSIVERLRDTTIYITIEKEIKVESENIRDTVFVENKFSYAISYVIDTTLFLELTQKQQELEQRFQFKEREFHSFRDSVRITQEIIQVNKLTKLQNFWIVAGYAGVILLLITIIAIIIYMNVRT